MVEPVDVVVLGAGPAAAFAAAACAEAGLIVALVAPDADDVWPARYGVFADELDGLGLGAYLDHRWLRPQVWGAGEPVALDRCYARVDSVGLARALRARLVAGGGRVRRGRAAAVHPLAGGAGGAGVVRVALVGGDDVHASVVVDASGVPGRAPGPRPLAWQQAFGEERVVTAGGWHGLGMRLMDWSPPNVAWARRWRRRPSFLYAMDLGDGRAFFEETELIARAPLGHDELRARLHARLRRMDAMAGEVVAVERCRLPMALAAAERSAGVVDYGARAGLVHPLTGYSLATSAALAPVLASALAAAHGAGVRGEAAAAAARAALRAAVDRGAGPLLRIGAAALEGQDGDELARFFGAFFRIPAAQWAPLMRRTASGVEVALAMARVYRACPASIRRRLLGALSARRPVAPNGSRAAATAPGKAGAAFGATTR